MSSSSLSSTNHLAQQQQQKQEELNKILNNFSFRICSQCHKLEYGELTEESIHDACYGPDHHQLSELKHQWVPATWKNTMGRTLYFAGHHYSLLDYISIKFSRGQPEVIAQEINSELIEYLKNHPFNKCIYCDVLLPEHMTLSKNQQQRVPSCTGPYNQYRNSQHEWRKATLSDAERYCIPLDEGCMTIRDCLKLGVPLFPSSNQKDENKILFSQLQQRDKVSPSRISIPQK